jgi:CubicO group peptidase (beta-lactamase class C family)
VTIEGLVEPGFGPVADALASAVPPDAPGAALAAVVDGRVVLDCYAGLAAPGRPWSADTICVIFSGTKGVVATAMLALVERGAFGLDQPVADFWPEFAANGKGAITVGDVLSHRAGLPGISAPASFGDVAHPERLEAMLAAQAPITPVGTPSYHAITYGWLCDGIARHTDGRRIAQVVADEVVAPLGMDFRIGTATADLPRVARLVRAPDFQLSALSDNADPDPRLELVYGNPELPGWNDPSVLQLEIPGGNGVGTAGALARMYGCLAGGGAPILRPETVAAGTAERSLGDDPLSGRLLRFGAGFELHGTPSRLGPAADAFGHTGSGGSTHGAWPSLRTGFSLIVAELRTESSDGRAPAVLDALHRAVTP